MKRIISVILCSVLITTVFLSAVPVSAYTQLVNKTDVAYPVNGGNIYFDANTGTITGCSKDVTTVNIPSSINGVTVTSIGRLAFYECYDLTSVSIPNTVTSIGSSAFVYCSKLVNVDLPNSITSISESMFAACSKLENIQIPNGVTSIGYRAFKYCENLENITIPNSVTTISGEAFFDCTSLTNISLPNNITSIGSYAFRGCTKLDSISIPNGVTRIDNYTFYGCTKLNEVLIPEGIISIGDGAFSNCIGLTNINIPNSTTRIGDSAFSNCSNLKSISLPERVTPSGAGTSNIGSRAFYNCTSLISINIPDGVKVISDEMFSNCTSLVSISIPDSVTHIGFNLNDGCVFSNCKNLNSITIPSSVKFISHESFLGCDGLRDVFYDDDEKAWNSINIEQGNDTLINAVIHYNATDSNINPESAIKQLYFIEPIVILDIGESKSLGVHSRDVANVNGELVYSNDKVVNAFDIDWNAELYEDSGIIKIDDNGQITGLSEGYEHILINSKNDLNLSSFCHVYVGEPNTVSFNCSYDTKYYYSDNAFVNSVATTSEYIDIQYDISNKIVNELRDVILETDYHKYFNDVSPITLTATVSGNNLSFSAQEYKNTYKTTISGLSIEEIINGSIKLFPYEMMIAENGNNYTVTFTLESESFDTIIKEYSFLIEKDSYNIKVYTSYPNSEIGVDQEVKLFVELYRNEALINCENGYSIVNSNSSVVKLTETKQSNGGYFFTLKGLAEGATNFTLIDSITKASRTIPINVVDKSKFIRCSATFDCLSADNVYITDYSCVINSNGNHDISFNAYNWSYAYGVVEVYDSNGKILKVEPINPRTDGSGTEKIVNGFRYAAIDLTSDAEWYKKESNTKHTAICLENLPVDAKIVVTSDGEVSSIPTLYTGVDAFVKVVLMASTLNVKTDAQEVAVKALLTEALKSVPESALKSASSELAKSMMVGATSESVSKAYEIIFNMFEGVGLDFGSIIKSTLMGMGYGAADSIVTTLIPAAQVVFIVDDALAILQPIVDYSYNLDKGKVEIHITKHGLQNYLTNSSVTITQESNFSKETILDAYIVVEDDELQRLPDSIAGDMLYYNIYNITLRENGKEVQPREEIEVRIHVPTSADGRKCVVYRIEENGERTLLQSRLDGNYLVFKTSHLSYYIVGQKDCEHSYPNIWSADSEYHWKECTVVGCGVIIDNSKAVHTPDRESSTETEAIKCSVCGYVITPALGHTHSHGTEWKYDEDNHWNECACGDKASTAAHTDVNKDGKCDVCEYEVGTVTPNPDNNPDDTNKPSDDVHSPQTGDNSMMWLWIIMLFVSGGALVSLTVYGRKRKSY